MLLAQFLVPRKRERTVSILHTFHAALLTRFGGYTLGQPVLGWWQDPEDGKIYPDQSDPYTVGFPYCGPDRSILEQLLGKLARDIGEKSIWCTFTIVEGGCIPASARA